MAAHFWILNIKQQACFSAVVFSFDSAKVMPFRNRKNILQAFDTQFVAR